MIWYCRFVTSSVLYAVAVWFPMSLSAVLGCKASTCWRSAVMVSMLSWSLWRFVMGVCFGLLYMFIIFVVRFVIIYFRLFYMIFLERIFLGDLAIIYQSQSRDDEFHTASFVL